GPTVIRWPLFRASSSALSTARRCPPWPRTTVQSTFALALGPIALFPAISSPPPYALHLPPQVVAVDPHNADHGDDNNHHRGNVLPTHEPSSGSGSGSGSVSYLPRASQPASKAMRSMAPRFSCLRNGIDLTSRSCHAPSSACPSLSPIALLSLRDQLGPPLAHRGPAVAAGPVALPILLTLTALPDRAVLHQQAQRGPASVASPLLEDVRHYPSSLARCSKSSASA